MTTPEALAFLSLGLARRTAVRPSSYGSLLTSTCTRASRTLASLPTLSTRFQPARKNFFGTSILCFKRHVFYGRRYWTAGSQSVPQREPEKEAEDKYGRRQFIGVGVGSAFAMSAFNAGSDAAGAAPSVSKAATLDEPLYVRPPIPGEFKELTKSISEFTLSNGMKFIVLEKHEAPVISCMIHANVGAIDEPEGKTGMAHFLEHLAFKGTSKIGTMDFEQEESLLENLDKLSTDIETLEATLPTFDAATRPQVEKRLEEMLGNFDNAIQVADEVVIPNEFGRIVEEAGGVGLNATTSLDATRYFYSFPANKLELFFLLESERFRDPVFRQFYKEKEVIKEERRLTVDNSPVGQLIEKYLQVAFTEHPYRRPVIGYPEDFANLTRKDIQDFFKEHYTPANLTAVVVGDVDPAQVREYARQYWERVPNAPSAAKNGAQDNHSMREPTQRQQREITVPVSAQEPLYIIGYHRPSINHPDAAVFLVLSSILADGRTSRLYRSLVDEQQICSSAEALNGFPGERYNTLLLLYGAPSPGRTLEEVAHGIDAEVEKLKRDGVTDAEVERVKRQSRKALLESLRHNDQMASLLAEYAVYTGDWRNLFRDLAAIDKVTGEDCLRVARATFRTENSTIGRSIPLSTAYADEDEEVV